MTFKNTVVHIGCFDEMPGSSDGPAVEPDTRYICFELVDKFKDIVDAEYAKVSSQYGKQVELRFASAKDTGLDASSVDAVHMYNVLGDPDVWKMDGFFVESKRILKQGSGLYIGETLTPYPIEDLILMGRKNGFSMKVLAPHPLEHVSEYELGRFYTIMAENTSNELYNKNFHEWYGLLEKMNLIGTYRLNDSEKKTIEQYKGTDKHYSSGSYLVKMIKQ